ncbi:MAG: phosphotransferase [Pseudomonadota bacterium]
MDKRLKQIEFWLPEVIGETILSLEVASADASFRRYFRATTKDGSYVVMDAPPDKEPLAPFIAIDRALLDLGVHAPAIHAEDLEQGFLLLEDLGNTTYLQKLPGSSQSLYSAAIDTLIKIQCGSDISPDHVLPAYDAARLRQEMGLFDDWYLKRHVDVQLNEAQQLIWNDTQQILIDACLEQPQVWVHRDYHSRNLMVTDQDSPAVIDFQDMCVGPISYDLASLFKDCYIEWPRDTQHEWLEAYYLRALNTVPNVNFSLSDLLRWFDLTGLQRHLKVLGIFCRLNYRDGKSHYLGDLPLVKKYTLEVLDYYPDLNNFRRMLTSLLESSGQGQ